MTKHYGHFVARNLVVGVYTRPSGLFLHAPELLMARNGRECRRRNFYGFLPLTVGKERERELVNPDEA